MAKGEGEGGPETRALTAFEDPGSTEADAQADTELVAEQEPQATPNGDEEEGTSTRPKASRKRKSDSVDGAPRPKRSRTKTAKAEHASGSSSPSKPPKVTLKLGPKPQESDVFPCCLCISTEREGLLRVHNPPVWQKEGQSGEGSAATSDWQAHEECANVIPETWVDEIEVGSALPDGTIPKERMVFGTDAIPRDRWNLVRSSYPFIRVYFLLIYLYIEMQCLLEDSAQSTWRANPVHEGQMPEGVPCLMRSQWIRRWYLVSGLEGSRERRSS